MLFYPTYTRVKHKTREFKTMYHTPCKQALTAILRYKLCDYNSVQADNTECHTIYLVKDTIK